MEYYGGSLYQKHSSEEVAESFLSDPLYQNNIKAWQEGVTYSQQFFSDPAVTALDFTKTHSRLAVKTYFFLGRHDYDTPAPLAEAYYRSLSAPKKSLVWFDRSAHFPFYEEKAKFIAELYKAIP